MKHPILILLALLVPSAACSQTSGADPWSPMRFFEGSWTGHETGRAGTGKGERTYEFIMEGTYLYFRNVSRFEPQEKNPEGETHEDWTFYSYDGGRGVLVMRQFNIEGFVNTFAADSVSAGGTFIRFTSEASENAPPGLQARMTYHITGEDSFTETFELAMPDGAFSVWLENHWTRKKQ